MHQQARKQQHRSGLTGGRYASALLVKLGYSVTVKSPQGVAGGVEVMPGIHHPMFVATRQKYQWAIGGGYVIEEDSDIHCPWFGH